MKVPFCIGLSAVCALIAHAQQVQEAQAGKPVSGEATVVERGANHRIWAKAIVITNSQGQVYYRTNSYTELATGLHHFKDGKWIETDTRIELTTDGAAAINGPHKVHFAANLNTEGSIDHTTPDGKRLRSHVTGLGYYDDSSGQAVLIAQTKDSIGLLRGENEVIYTNAFDDVDADVQYIYTRGGLEQNIVLREQPPSPAQFGLRPGSTKLQVITEFFDSPAPRKQIVPAGQLHSLADEVLDFGQMKIGTGRAFRIGEESTPGGQVRVTKEWGVAGGRTFLVEQVPFKQVDEHLRGFIKKRRNALFRSRPQGQGRDVMTALNGILPRQIAQSSRDSGMMRIAKTRVPPESGFVLDYAALSSATNFTFRGDTTYLISGAVNLSGTTTIEGGTVVKVFDDTNHLPIISLNGPLVCQTGPYRPGIFTSSNDDSVGEQIDGSSGIPSASTTFLIQAFGPGSGVTWDVKYLRMAYGFGGFVAYDARNVLIRNCQFIDSTYAVGALDGDLILENVLFSNCYVPMFAKTNAGLTQVTVDGYSILCSSAGGFSSLGITNSLIVGTGDLTGSEGGGSVPTPIWDHSVQSSSAAGLFQATGAGYYYLTGSNSNRNAGTTNLSAALLTDLRNKTTYSPIVISNVTINADTNLLPQIQRDTDVPDLGYHYDPLDYILQMCAVTNATVRISGGAAIAYNNAVAGIWLQEGSAISSTGTPVLPNSFVHYPLVQEQPIFVGDTPPPYCLGINPAHFTGPPASGEFRFTRFMGSAGLYNFYHVSNLSYSNVIVQDCEFWNGRIDLGGTTGTVAVVKNNLFQRSAISATGIGSTTLTFSNNLVWGGNVDLLNLDPSNFWRFHNNAFDSSAVSSSINPLTNSHNAYINCIGRLYPTNANDQVLSGFTYSSGPLGDYYQASTNLMNAGSVSDAALVGLYHYTVTTNLIGGSQVKETNSVVDIGFHYVAVNSGGQPIDTDGDGIPDYLEDRNGNGTYENGDLASWLTTDSDGDGVSDPSEIAQGRNPNGANTAADPLNKINLRLFKPLY